MKVLTAGSTIHAVEPGRAGRVGEMGCLSNAWLTSEDHLRSRGRVPVLGPRMPREKCLAEDFVRGTESELDNRVCHQGYREAPRTMKNTSTCLTSLERDLWRILK
jgi:hypothetical protein